MTNVQTFQFHVSKEFLTLPFETAIYLTISYFVEDAKVILFSIEIPPPVLPYLKDCAGIVNQIQLAAEHNAMSMGSWKPVSNLKALVS